MESITKASIKLGISRSTLYRWINRYNQEGKLGLSDKSHRPKNLTIQKVDFELEEEILAIRKKRNWGPQRISSFLLRKRRIELSPMTIWRVYRSIKLSLFSNGEKRVILSDTTNPYQAKGFKWMLRNSSPKHISLLQ